MQERFSTTELELLEGLEGVEAHCPGTMQARTAEGRARKLEDYNGAAQHNANDDRGYFSLQSFLVLLCITASLVILPLILPPLPPPPFMLLLLPIGIFVVLLILAFMPSDVRDITSSYM
ncbi:protein AUXIN-REGULATED GENE INVOLVED IN ORGAN SIZE-like [Asparagus officinalis]|uniref:protein AUXIN-REGULATED GENE INVOLVED IN ORGAN SIZE-like n=1 Tax=Asparagus officinalis TaxID=4686 RepID=UPI00098E3121|nr:protein AUXIN-REGULATED GENE INVOLVED IN ORGAN SIZE-like [Asparagus officinalis]